MVQVGSKILNKLKEYEIIFIIIFGFLQTYILIQQNEISLLQTELQLQF
jgi:hypothetical protein